MSIENSTNNLYNKANTYVDDFSPPFNFELIEQGVKMILQGIGEDINRDGLKRTPYRVAKMYRELCSSIQKPMEELEITTFHDEAAGEIIVVKDIYFSTICEHHLLPFFGLAHIAYSPGNNKIIGLSKLARIVDYHAKKLQVQERMTREIAKTISNSLNAQGVMVMLKAEHLCMSIRGTNKPGSKTNTIYSLGSFARDERAKAQAFDLIKF